MSDLVNFLQNPSLIVVITVAALILLLVGFVSVNIISNLRLLHQRQRALAGGITQLNEGHVKICLGLEAIADRIQQRDTQDMKIFEHLDQTRAELVRMSQLIGGENQMAKAIDMARNGAMPSEIILATAIAEDEAEAIVKFHGPAKR